MRGEILCGDSLRLLRDFPDNHFSAVVADSPYGLSRAPDLAEVMRDWLRKGYHAMGARGGFMGKNWDSFVPQPRFWKEVLRVMRPGGHLVSFFGARTYHLGVTALQLAGWEIRDQLEWLYGQGFPKSLDISKAIDKEAGIDREDKFEGAIHRDKGPTGNKRCHTCGKWLISGNPCKCPRPQDNPVSDAAKGWQGYGTGLKPAHEPIVLARKPLDGTNVDNTLKWQTGGLNIEGSMIPFRNPDDYQSATYGVGVNIRGGNYGNGSPTDKRNIRANPAGRWPANVLLDPVAAAVLDKQSGVLQSGMPGTHGRSRDYRVFHKGSRETGTPMTGWGDSGGASRFFYVAKASTTERQAGLATGQEGGGEVLENTNPCVKPLDLMRYLVRLVTPPGGLVLDPFAGSGSTGCACEMEGADYVLMEQNAHDCQVARARCRHWAIRYHELTVQYSLFPNHNF